MKSGTIGLSIVFCLFLGIVTLAQQAPSQDATVNVPASAAAGVSAEVIVPRLMKFSGTLLDAQNRPMTGPVGVTFALYAQESNGSALWMETQNVYPDANGNYTVLLGAASKDGLPAEQFVTGEARWLGLQVENHPERSRVLLVSVPYAIKAHDAETLGGLPPSAFVQSTQSAASSGSSNTSVSSSGTAPNGTPQAGGPLAPACAFTGGGTLNFIPIWTGACSLGNSSFFQTGGNVGLSTITPAAKLDVAAPAADATGIRAVAPSTAFFAAAMFGHATGATGVTRGVYGVADSPSGIGVHGIAATGGQFETGTATGNILVGRGLGFTRFSISPVGNVHTTGNIRIDGGFSAGGSGLFQVDAPGIVGGRLTILANGNVGINNPAPSDTLDVKSANTGGATAIVGQTAVAAIPGTGVLGKAGADGVGVAGTASVVSCGSLELCSATGVSGRASGSTFPIGVSGFASGAGGVGVSGQSDVNVGVQGIVTSTTGSTVGVSGSVKSPSGIGAEGVGPNTGMQGVATSAAFFAAGVFGHATATTGTTRGVYGVSESSSGIGVHGIAAIGGQFESGTGTEILGRGFGHTNFRVDATGKVFADGGFQTGGADFAESFAVRGDRDRYEVGDLLVIDQSGTRRLALAQHAYSKLVAGIYSTKPGLLGTVHTMFEREIQQEIPLAVVGVVPCKVSAENGSIKPGDLLVTSNAPGFAMKGTNQKKMLGAIVGKALESLPSGKGTILVLVTLQ